MPLNAHPPTIDGPSFDEKRAAAERSSLVDFGLWGGLVPGNVDQLEILRDRGVVGLKAFMSNSGIDDFASVDTATLRAGMKHAAKLGLIVAVHAEAEEITRELTQQKIAAGKTLVRDYLGSRPLCAELEAIRTAIDLAAETNCRLHIVHVSSGSGVRLVAEGRANQIDVSCETCPHYLFMTEDDMNALGAVAKCAPPLRSAQEQEALWQGLGDVDTIGSDHSPSPWKMKERPNFFEVWGGISGCQHLLPLLAGSAKLSLSEIARLTSRGVAARFSIPRKGRIEIGQDADLVLLDPHAEETIRVESLQYRHRHTPYAGRKLRVRVVRTFLRGQTIFKDGKFALRSCGRFVRPGLA